MIEWIEEDLKLEQVKKSYDVYGITSSSSPKLFSTDFIEDAWPRELILLVALVTLRI